MEIEAITVETMKPLLGKSFDLVGHDVQLTLTEVEEKDTGDAPMVSFVLLFEGPTTPSLEQGNWALTNDDKQFDVFLVPIGPRSSGQPGYEAVFSRLID